MPPINPEMEPLPPRHPTHPIEQLVLDARAWLLENHILEATEATPRQVFGAIEAHYEGGLKRFIKDGDIAIALDVVENHIDNSQNSPNTVD